MATINIAELSEALSTDGRTARKFLRSVTPKESQPGKGARWSIEKTALRTLKVQFKQYQAAAMTKGAVDAPAADADPEVTTD